SIRKCCPWAYGSDRTAIKKFRPSPTGRLFLCHGSLWYKLETDQSVPIDLEEFDLVQGIDQGRVPWGLHLYIVFGKPMDIAQFVLPFEQHGTDTAQLAFVK